MFAATPTLQGIAVPDLPAARRFYGGVLGLAVEDGPFETLTLTLSGGRELLVYRKPDHAPATYTVLNFLVRDIDDALDALESRGVETLRYSVMNQDERGVVRAEGPIAWFADPAGNVLAVIEER